MEELEELLHKKQLIYSRFNNAQSNMKAERLKADKGASLFDFIKLVGILVELTMPGVRFEPDEGKLELLDAMNKIEKSFITYKVIKRNAKLELKPRLMEEKIINQSDDVAEIWTQDFECYVQFNIFTSVYKDAEEVMSKFEEMMLCHSNFIKRNGVGDLIFDGHFTDSHFDTFRETLSIRNLRYYVRIQKTTVMLRERINQIELEAQKKKDEEEQPYGTI